jgi:gas vesicle protein
MNTGKALLGVLIGAVAGVAIGALFTDKRAKISDEKFDDLLSVIKDKMKNTKATEDVKTKLPSP